MCQYIKDGGEQCGMDSEPFCHHHEDSGQAKLWRRIDERADELMGQIRLLGGSLREVNENRSQDADAVSEGVEMDATCGDCEAPLRRTERLTEHPRIGGRALFEAVVECDCDEHVLGAQSVRLGDLPGGWT